jgi:hypothetical protein
MLTALLVSTRAHWHFRVIRLTQKW